MVMIVKDHEKKAHGFISVTRYGCYPGSTADSKIRYGAGAQKSAWRGARSQLAAAGAGPWPPRPWGCAGRNLAFGLPLSWQARFSPRAAVRNEAPPPPRAARDPSSS